MKILTKMLLLICCYSAMVFADDVSTQQTNTNAAPENAQGENAASQNAKPANPEPIKNSDLNITGAYVQALIPGQNNTTAYMTINNNTKQTYVLTGAYSSMAQQTQLHTVLMQEGVMKMRSVDAITLLPLQQVVLQPGDFHIMLMGVNTELTKDTLVPLCLKFKDSADICMDVPVIDKHTTDQHQH